MRYFFCQKSNCKSNSPFLSFSAFSRLLAFSSELDFQTFQLQLQCNVVSKRRWQDTQKWWPYYGLMQFEGLDDKKSDTSRILHVNVNVVFKELERTLLVSIPSSPLLAYLSFLFSVSSLLPARNNLLGKILQKRLTLSQALISVMFHTSTLAQSNVHTFSVD